MLLQGQEDTQDTVILQVDSWACRLTDLTLAHIIDNSRQLCLETERFLVVSKMAFAQFLVEARKTQSLMAPNKAIYQGKSRELSGVPALSPKTL